MTSRQDLIALGKHHELPGTREILLAIQEAHAQLDLATWQLSVRAQSAIQAKEAGTYTVVGSFVKEAADYESAAAKLDTLFLTLACVLQNAGIKLDY